MQFVENDGVGPLRHRRGALLNEHGASSVVQAATALVPKELCATAFALAIDLAAAATAELPVIVTCPAVGVRSQRAWDGRVFCMGSRLTVPPTPRSRQGGPARRPMALLVAVEHP